MLTKISIKCAETLLIYKGKDENKRAIYKYGFELLFSTSFCACSILLIGIVLKQFYLTITFLIHFIPIRIVAGGYHAKSYRKCFFISNLIALITIWISKLLFLENIWLINWIQIILFVLSVDFIWKNAPIKSKKYCLPESRVKYNRQFTHRILIIELVSINLIWWVGARDVAITSSVTYIMVAAMMKLGKEKLL